MKSLHLYPQPIEKREQYKRRSCILEFRTDEQLDNSDVLWYDLSGGENLPDDDDAESYLIAMLMQAMLENRKIYAHGSVSQSLLANLTEYRDAWCCWLPLTYHPIEFEVDKVVDESKKPLGAVCAFSGGVDATFSVWRHTQKLNGYRSQDIKMCTMVHGYDIPLEDEEAFASAAHHASVTLKSLGLPLIPLRTNLREIIRRRAIRVNWEHHHAAGLVSALQNFKKVVGNCIIGSGPKYSALVIPWGSNPMTDPLLSSDRFSVIHDGATYGRIEKIKVISNWKEGQDNLRVCWEGTRKDRNCGKCEKCLRTQLDFRAHNLAIPNCFPKNLVLSAAINQLRIHIHILPEWKQILETATSNDVKDDWVKTLNKKIKREESKNPLLSLMKIRKRMVNKMKSMLKTVKSWQNSEERTAS